MPEDTTLVVISTSVVALVTGFLLGIYSIQGYIITPEFAKQSRANYEDPVDSDETDIDEDDTHMDHAPNWANGEEADRKQGLRFTGNDKSKTDKKASSRPGVLPSVEDTGEECKLILVVRTDLGMTKGRRAHLPTTPSSL
jgi:peptidyl-tRNA hydrolase, PTH2 family